MPTANCTPRRPPAPGTHATLHMLIGGGHMPVVTADLGEVVDQPVLYLRLAVEDMPRQGPRHEVNLSFSGPPADVVRLVADLAAAVEQAQPPEG